MPQLPEDTPRLNFGPKLTRKIVDGVTSYRLTRVVDPWLFFVYYGFWKSEQTDAASAENAAPDTLRVCCYDPEGAAKIAGDEPMPNNEFTLEFRVDFQSRPEGVGFEIQGAPMRLDLGDFTLGEMIRLKDGLDARLYGAKHVSRKINEDAA